MTFLNDREEDGTEGLELRPLELPCGRVVLLDARIFPEVAEWDWYHDPKTALVVRDDEAGRKIRLYDEQVKRNRGIDGGFGFPCLDRMALRRMFGHTREWRTLIAVSRRQRTIAHIAEFPLPLPTDYLGLALAYALTRFYVWQEETDRPVFHPDGDNLTPGQILPDSGAKPIYRTLGEWMDGEVSGEWRSLETAPTGIVPESVAQQVEWGLHAVWRLAFLNRSGPEQDAAEAEVLLALAGRGVAAIVEPALKLVRRYQL
jgi:hypothetical protein